MRAMLPRWRRVAAALVSIGGITAVGVWLFPRSATTAALALLFAVLVVGSLSTLADAILISCLAALALDIFFIPPIGKVEVSDPQSWVALAVFLGTAIAASNMSHRLRKQQEELIRQRQETELLHALSRSMLLSGTAAEMKQSIVTKVLELFRLREFILFEAASGQFFRSHPDSAIGEERLRRASRSRTEEEDREGVLIYPLTLGNTTLGSMALRQGEAALPARLTSAIASTVALGLAQAQAQRVASQAEIVRRSEELKSVMIDALAHDLKSPLTAIEASAEMLADSNGMQAAQRADLVSVIREESSALGRLIDEAIHLSRIDAERLRLQSQQENPRQLVEEALDSLRDRVNGREMVLEMKNEMRPVNVDRVLMVQAIKQLVDNAMKYSPAQASVTIRAREEDDEMTVSVRDQGPGLTELEQSRVFDKFYRGRYDRSAVPGTGMGLAIAKEIVEAHGGSIGVQSRVGDGSEFYITLRTGAAVKP